MKDLNGKFLHLTLFFLISYCSSYSQDTKWLRINPLPYESTINSVTVIPGLNKVVAVGDYATVMYSENNGEDWAQQRRPAGIPKSSVLLSVTFPSATHGYILGAESLLLKTIDGGASWQDISLEGNYKHMEVHFKDNETGFITGANGYLLRTENGGNTWDTISTRTGIATALPHFIDDSTGFMGYTSGNFYLKTSDAGLSWDSIPFLSDPINYRVYGVKFLNDSLGFITSFVGYYNYNGMIHKTTDGGQTWYEVYNDGLYFPMDFYFHNPDTGFNLGVTSMYKDCVLRTTDGGETWTYDDDFHWHLNSMVFTLEGVGILFGTYSRIYRTFDMGLTWEPQSSTVFKSTLSSAVKLNDSVIIAGGIESSGGVPGGSIIRSADGGWTWTWVCSTYGEVTDIDFPDEQTGYAVTTAGFFYKSTDGGLTWDDGDEISYNEFYAVAFINPLKGFVAGVISPWDWHDSMFKTEDGGETWQRLDTSETQLRAGYVYDICFADEMTGYLCGDIQGIGHYTFGGIMKTTDGGNTWAFLDLDVNTYDKLDVECVGKNIVFLAGSDFILKSGSAGTTWSYLPVPENSITGFRSVSFLDESIGFATGDGPEANIIKTVDGGNSWEVMQSPTPALLTGATFFEEDKGLIFGSSGVIFKLDTGYVVGINEEDILSRDNSPVKFYPNPVSDILKIKFNGNHASAFTLDVYTILGNKLFTRNNISPENTCSINLNDLPDGIYLVLLQNRDKQYQSKIIKISP